MERFVPMGIFEHDTQAVVAIDENASIRLANRAARRLLGLAPTNGLPSHCWLMSGFRTPDGLAFCGPDCPVQEAARIGMAGAHHWVVAARGPTAGHMVEMVTFMVPNGRSDRTGVLHFFRPVASRVAHPRCASVPSGEVTLAPAGELSKREEEVLAKLAEGLSTDALARDLGISATTVRNHIQSILRKLGVHRRIEAVVAYGRGVEPAPEQ